MTAGGRERSVCLAVLTYNGVRHLEHLLPSLREAVAVYGRPCPVVVLDNRSPDGDAEWTRRAHPWCEVVEAPANDFLFSYNWLCERRGEDVVIFLNNDLRADPGFIAPLMRHFERPEVFAVAACCKSWDGMEHQTGPAVPHLHRGWFSVTFDTRRQEAGPTFFAGGGYAAVDRKKFLEIGGFDRLFFPAYGEDLDLSFRAWARGWESWYEPASVLYHRENGSFGDTARGHIARAQLLFQWRNLRDPVLRVRRAVYTAWKRLWLDRASGVWVGAFREACAVWRERGADACARFAAGRAGGATLGRLMERIGAAS